MESTALVKQKKEATRKGVKALAALAGTVALFGVGATWLAIPGVGLTGVLAYKWFAHRAKWGLKF